MAFASARGGRSQDLEGDGLREADGSDRFGRNIALRRRNDNDQDSDGWTPVKPRKSFGADGAERFAAGRMGSFRDEKRPQRDRDEREPIRERPMRNFDPLTRDRAADDEARPRNGLTRSKSDWNGKTDAESPAPDKRERIDRAKNWRERDPVIEEDRRNKTKDRRWGRDGDNYRNEQDPEWFDEPAEPKQEKRTQQDFQKWMEEMKRAKNSAAAAEQSSSTAAADAVDFHRATIQSAPTVEAGPDKFFLNFGGSTGLDASSPASEQPGQPPKSKAPGKSSRFTSFFNAGPQAAAPTPPAEEIHSRPEPANPLAAFAMGALAGAMPSGNAPPSTTSPQGNQGAEEERQAFQQLIMKLHKQSNTATPPGLSPFPIPTQQQPQQTAAPSQEPGHMQQHIPHSGSKKSTVASPESFQPYGIGAERREGPMGPPPPQSIHAMSPPSQPQSQAQSQAAYSNQLMQDIMGHHRRLSSQTSQRAENNNASRNNSNTEFLMNLMRAAPTGQGPQQHNMQMGQPPKQSPMPQHHEREPEYTRDSRASQRSSRQQQPPGFGMDEPFHHPESEQRQSHPTQILQRPVPPPGLDQMGHNWMPGGGQMPPPPPQQRGGPMAPPPGLAGGPTRSLPMQHMFPPNFPPGGMPPPEAMGGIPPPRNMPPPPPGFFNGPPPPGYLPPGMEGFNGPPPGMDSHFIGSPFEGGRGMPPPGNGGRGAFGRQ